MKKPNEEKTIAIMVGVGKREEDEPALAYTASDALRVKDALLSRCPFTEANCYEFINEKATTKYFSDKLLEISQLTQNNPAELVVVYFSGHGHMLDDELYLIFRNTLNDDISNTALKAADLLDMLDGIETEKLLILLDCCHANGINGPQTISLGTSKKYLTKPNRLVISSSHVSQLSFISEPVSIFTFALLEGLAGAHFKPGDKDVTVFGLAMYIRERVYPLSKRRQQPQLDIIRNGNTVNFVLTRYPNGNTTPAFEEGFKLLNEAGKAIDVSLPAEADQEFRQQFQWIENTTITNNTINNTTNNTTNNTSFEKQTNFNTQGNTNVFIGVSPEEFNKIFKTPPPPKKQKSIETILLVKKKMLVFVGRKIVKQHIEKIIKNEALRLFVLFGDNKSGLTYIKHLLSDISQEYRYYEFRYINITEISAEYNTEKIGPLHIAEAISDKLGLNFDKNEFKMSRFLSVLNTKLTQQVEKGITYLLHFDQFIDQKNLLLDEFMKALVNMVVDENAPIILVIGGYRQVLEWPTELQIFSYPQTFETHFNRKEIDDFLKQLYYDDVYAIHKTTNWNTFLQSTKKYLPDTCFNDEDKASVKQVGDALNTWLRSILTN